MLKKIKNQWLPYFVLLGFVGILSLTMYFSPISNGMFGHDAGIFAYIGMALTKGEVLYTGAWDNKGPLLYFINALGVFINYRYGIYLMELISLFVASVFLYKTGMLFGSRSRALVCSVFCMLSLISTLEGGNLSEEYALPFTTIAFYFIAKFFKNEFALKKYEMMVVGACIAAIAVLRLNILAFLAVAVLGVIIVLATKKEYKTLITVTVFALLGFFLFLAPFVVYLVKTGSLKMCIDTVYLGVLGFFSDISIVERASNILDMILYMRHSWMLHLVVVFVIAFPICFIKNKSNRSVLDVLGAISFFGLFTTLLANSISGANHAHYFICFVPTLIIPAIWLFEKAEQIIDKRYWKKWVFPLVTVVIAVVFFSTVYMPIINNMGREYNKIHEKTTYLATEKYIINNSDETDRIIVLGEQNAATIYYRANRLSASNFFYYANGRFSDESKVWFADEISSDTIEAKPKLIMFETKEKMDDFLAHLTDRQKWEDFIENEYTVEEENFFYKVYKRNY